MVKYNHLKKYINVKEKEYFYIKMVIYTKESLNKIKDKEKVLIYKIALDGIKDNLIMILKKVKEYKFFTKKMLLKVIF